MNSTLRKIYKGMTVLITGHTGFKGSWLSIWLNELGANPIGYSIDPPTQPNNFELCRLHDKMEDIRGDVRDYAKLEQVIEKYSPRIVFHLAAQPIVLHSYEHPKETLDVNVGGTTNILEALRKTKTAGAFVGITSDKCYEDRNMVWGYRENDPLGGFDPYSASKAMAELAIASYRNSFFPPEKIADHSLAIASARAGNVIGGGDFADFRLLPDCMKALMNKEAVIVRNPASIRSWQHVLVPLSGYLLLGVKLLENSEAFSGAWNFGPSEMQPMTTQAVVEHAIRCWGSGEWRHEPSAAPRKETEVLKLNWEKAASQLNWLPAYPWETAVTKTVDWFREYHIRRSDPRSDMYPVCATDIQDYMKDAARKGMTWCE
ncbi:MAG: CDP-glucose 4,6-dehydratase [Thermodesulfobacteriota bacterium]